MSGFESVTGMGVYATVDGTRVDVGLIAICAKLAWILAASPPPPNG